MRRRRRRGASVTVLSNDGCIVPDLRLPTRDDADHLVLRVRGWDLVRYATRSSCRPGRRRAADLAAVHRSNPVLRPNSRRPRHAAPPSPPDRTTPDQTPEPIMALPNRAPSSSVQFTSSTGCLRSGCPDSFSVRITSSPAITPKRAVELAAGGLAVQVAAEHARVGAPGRGPRGGRTCCRLRRCARPARPPRTSRGTAPARPGPRRSDASRRTPPFAVAPTSAIAIRLSHSRRPSMRWLLAWCGHAVSPKRTATHLARVRV